jgi:hypothetical protein
MTKKTTTTAAQTKNLLLVVLCPHGEPAVSGLFDMEYGKISKFVGGLVENAYVTNGIELVCNETGSYTHPLNRRVPAFAPALPDWLSDADVLCLDDDALLPPDSKEQGYHLVHGNFIICGSGWTTLINEQAEYWRGVLNQPENIARDPSGSGFPGTR